MGSNSAPLLYEGAGITPRDVSIAEIYDPFTFMCMTHIEDFGLVKKGEIGGWVTAGHNRLDGTLPVNTHGGLMSEAHIHGLNHVIEAVQQLRPKALSMICAKVLIPMTVPLAARCETPRSRWYAENVARAPCS